MADEKARGIDRVLQRQVVIVAWIESHQELARHPKTKRLARKLSVSLPAAVGHLHFLWWWAMDYAQDGSLAKFTNDDIADAVAWDGDADHLVNALIESGFIDHTDDGLIIHDWYEYAGRLIEKKEQNRERKRRSRAKKEEVTQMSHGSHADNRVTDEGVTGLPNQTKPNHTIPNQTNSSSGSSDDGAAELFRLFDENFVGQNAFMYEKLSSYLDDGLEPALIIEAIKITKQNGKNLNYFWGILNKFMEQGIRTIQEYQDALAMQKKERAGPNKQPKVPRAFESLNEWVEQSG